MQSLSYTCEVALFTGLKKHLSYSFAKDMPLQIGSLVQVPLGKRTCLGLVSRLGSQENLSTINLKPIQKLLYPYPIVTSDLIAIADWVSRYYAASIESVWECIVPKVIRQAKQQATERVFTLIEKFSQQVYEHLLKKSKKQALIYKLFENNYSSLSTNDIQKALEPEEFSSQALEALTKKNILQKNTLQKAHLAYEDDLIDYVPTLAPKLNSQQETCAKAILESLSSDRFNTHLLHGITGSGKTEVYLKSIEYALQKNQGTIFLVPELILTPQIVQHIRSRFTQYKTKTVVWHSQLSQAERLDAWLAIVKGEAQIVVGARSAIFLPIKNLKLIIVDEEHEPSYKQDEAPRYHGRDVAVYRAKLLEATCVLGSATPSLESLYNTKFKQYKLNKLTQRIDGCQLPTLHIVDMKMQRHSATDSTPILAPFLINKLIDRLDKKEQAILFLNKRGYASSMICPDCSYVKMCQHCSLSLTYHKNTEKLHCHICNYTQDAPTKCPQCSSSKIRWRGFGTQRIEDILKQILPKANIARMDSDVLAQKNKFRQLLQSFKLGKIDILIGTQMIAKGLDFPNVTLVGLINTDLSLHQPDFRASERTFQLLVQVSGRAGRGSRLGEVVIQTFTPHSNAIQCARQGDFDGFLEEELKQRQEFHYPPFRHLIRHIFRSKNLEKLIFFTEQWAQALEKHAENRIELRGPSPAPIEKIKDYYRYHLWYFVDNTPKALYTITHLLKTFNMDPEIIEVLDVDPIFLA